MAKFVSGEEQTKWLYDIIWNAQKTLLMVTPFLKLDEYYKRLFNKHLYNPNLHLVVIFGKAEGEKYSAIRNDIDFFKRFPNVSLVYVPDIRSRYYANEAKGLITSLSLTESQAKDNIDFGVADETPDSNKVAIKDYDTQVWGFCMHMAETGDITFVKRPCYERKIYSSLFGKNFVRSEVLLDMTSGSLEIALQAKTQKKRIADFPEFIELSPRIASSFQGGKPENRTTIMNMGETSQQFGYCIRTGEKIQFNPKRPMNDSSYDTWAFFMDYDYPEKYCHRTGKLSYGKTTFRNPILY